MSDKEMEILEEQYEQEAAAGYQKALTSPWPQESSLLKNVY